MSTKELQTKLRELGKAVKGQRPVLVRRYEQATAGEGREEGAPPEDARGERSEAHATEHPVMVMVDESTGNKYMRMVEHKGLEGEGDNSWLVKDMHQELKSWEHPGGGRNALILRAMVRLPSWQSERH